MYGLFFLLDKLYLLDFYCIKIGNFISFKNSIGFNEFLQWLKVNNRHVEYGKTTEKTDKTLSVEKYLIEIILLGYECGKEYHNKVDYNKCC